MAIYTGFFDAAFDETTGTYDKEYDSTDFTSYFGEIVGSGVCVYGNDDSMRVYYDVASNRAVVNPGYLFIRGYWLKNDGLYTVDLSSLPAGTYAIYAELSVGGRSITIGQKPKADPEEYPDALVLAYATIDSASMATIEDTRSRTDICGLIDSAGNLSVKIEYAINYIDDEIESKLDQIEADLQQKETEIDGKIAEANALIEQIAPPAIGTIKFSASSEIEDGWLKCDGSFITESQYPDLVAALGKLIPSGDKFQLLSSGEIDPTITNGVLYDGRIWVYSWSSQKLFGVDVDGEQPIKEISITCEDTYFPNLQNPFTGNPLALSIVSDQQGGYKIFLAQILETVEFSDVSVGTQYTDTSKILIFAGTMSSSVDNIVLTRPFTIIEKATETTSAKKLANTGTIPYVISKIISGQTTYYTATYKRSDTTRVSECTLFVYLTWGETGQTAKANLYLVDSGSSNRFPFILGANYIGFSKKTNDELIVEEEVSSSNDTARQGVVSVPLDVFSRNISTNATISNQFFLSVSTPTVMPIVGLNDFLLCFFSISNQIKIITLNRNNLSYASSLEITNLALPSGFRTFRDAAAYLWGKDMYFIFVGTGIIFSRDLTTNSFGYLDTTSVLGQIMQGGYLDYEQDEGTLYIVGQDSANQVKVAKIVLNTLYDYANDGAWLPLIASDGVPAYIKAEESST